MEIRIEKENKYFELCESKERWDEEMDGHHDLPEGCHSCPSFIKNECIRGEFKEVIVPESAIYHKAIKEGGISFQEDMTSEEIGELMVQMGEVLKDMKKKDRKINDVPDDDFIEEMVDLDILLGQWARYIGEDVWKEIKKKKLKRLYEDYMT